MIFAGFVETSWTKEPIDPALADAEMEQDGQPHLNRVLSPLRPFNGRAHVAVARLRIEAVVIGAHHLKAVVRQRLPEQVLVFLELDRWKVGDEQTSVCVVE